MNTTETDTVDRYDNYAWTVDPDPSGGDPPIWVDGVDGNMPEYRRGKEIDLTFLLWDSTLNGRTVPNNSGGTLSGAGGFTWGGAGGATYGSTPSNPDYKTRYNRLRKYGEYAGAAAHGTSANHRPWYREQLPPSAPVDSIVVAIEPGQAIEDTPAFWALLTDITDDTDLMQNYARVTFRAVMLAEVSEYPTKSGLESALADTL